MTNPIGLERTDKDNWILTIEHPSRPTFQCRLTTEEVRATFKVWRDEIRMQPVKSSNIDLIGYDADTWNLAVEFKGGARYLYIDVPPDVASPLTGERADADTFSVGGYFNAEVKAYPARYAYRRIN